MSFKELGQLDLIKCSKFLSSAMDTRCPIDPLCVEFILGPLENKMLP